MGSHVANSIVGFSWAAQNKLQAHKGERVKTKIKRKKDRPSNNVHDSLQIESIGWKSKVRYKSKEGTGEADKIRRI